MNPKSSKQPRYSVDFLVNSHLEILSLIRNQSKEKAKQVSVSLTQYDYILVEDKKMALKKWSVYTENWLCSCNKEKFKDKYKRNSNWVLEVFPEASNNLKNLQKAPVDYLSCLKSQNRGAYIEATVNFISGVCPCLGPLPFLRGD